MSVMTVRYLGAVQFEAETRGHKIFCDQPVSNGGFDEGMTPVDFLLASLGTCAGYYAAEYLNKNHLPSEGLTVTVEADKVKGPGRLDNFRIGVQVGALLPAPHQEGVKHAVEKCLVHNTLLNKPSITTTLSLPKPVTEPVIE
ncbi:MAG: OsmC family protein [Bryobacteraceae bacterium]|nr:OsmC family protein [Bryobacteraceae bacterium]